MTPRCDKCRHSQRAKHTIEYFGVVKWREDDLLCLCPGCHIEVISEMESRNGECKSFEGVPS